MAYIRHAYYNSISDIYTSIKRKFKVFFFSSGTKSQLLKCPTSRQKFKHSLYSYKIKTHNKLFVFLDPHNVSL